MKLDHVAQQTPDIAAAVSWYQRVFEQVEVRYQDSTWALLDVEGTPVALVVPGQHPAHLAWRVDGPHLEKLAERLGGTIAPHRDGSRSFYLEGLKGVAIEFISYPDDA